MINTVVRIVFVASLLNIILTFLFQKPKLLNLDVILVILESVFKIFVGKARFDQIGFNE